MRSFFGDPILVHTNMDPVAAHTAHLRHLTNPATLERLAIERHGFNRRDARKVTREAAAFIHQGLQFIESSEAGSPRVRPVTQYYGYLNLAVACVLLYRPKDWEQYRMHGAIDLSRELTNIALGTEVVKARKGAIPLFHSIISSGSLPVSPLRLRDLLVAVPNVGAELEHNFGLQVFLLEISGDVAADEGNGSRVSSTFTSEVRTPSGRPGNIEARFPARRMGSAMPILREHYRLKSKETAKRVYVSKSNWSEQNRERAERFHQKVALKLVNFGGQQVGDDGTVANFWRFRPNTPLIPTLTAGLLLGFVLASLSRYRANVLSSVQNSKMNLLCEVFASEASGVMIPAFRNLLYGETMFIRRTAFT